jgi:hypothetical protein
MAPRYRARVDGSTVATANSGIQSDSAAPRAARTPCIVAARARKLTAARRMVRCGTRVQPQQWTRHPNHHKCLREGEAESFSPDILRRLWVQLRAVCERRLECCGNGWPRYARLLLVPTRMRHIMFRTQATPTPASQQHIGMMPGHSQLLLPLHVASDVGGAAVRLPRRRCRCNVRPMPPCVTRNQAACI